MARSNVIENGHGNRFVIPFDGTITAVFVRDRNVQLGSPIPAKRGDAFDVEWNAADRIVVRLNSKVVAVVDPEALPPEEEQKPAKGGDDADFN